MRNADDHPFVGMDIRFSFDPVHGVGNTAEGRVIAVDKDPDGEQRLAIEAKETATQTLDYYEYVEDGETYGELYRQSDVARPLHIGENVEYEVR